MKVALSGSYKVTHRKVSGEVAHYEFPNGITETGVSDLVDVYFFGLAKRGTFYLGLIETSDPTNELKADDTLASNSWDNEFEDYAGGRPTWDPDAAGSVSALAFMQNAANPAIFEITRSTTLAGVFLTDGELKGTTGDLLFSHAINEFDVSSGDTLEYTYAVQIRVEPPSPSTTSGGVTIEGAKDMLETYFRSTLQQTWYVGLIDDTGFIGFDRDDTMASAGWQEMTAISSNRPTLTGTSKTFFLDLNTNGTEKVSGIMVIQFNFTAFDITANSESNGFFFVSDAFVGATNGTLFATQKAATDIRIFFGGGSLSSYRHTHHVDEDFNVQISFEILLEQ